MSGNRIDLSLIVIVKIILIVTIEIPTAQSNETFLRHFKIENLPHYLE